MDTTNRFSEIIKTKHIIYSVLLAVAFSWPWVWMATTGSVGEGDLVDLLSLGMIPVIVIGAIIMYKETKSDSAFYRAAFTIALIAAFLLVWIIPAVGIYGHSGDPSDLPFYGILVLGITGALISRFRSGGMAYTLGAMAIAQILVEVIGVIAGLGSRIVLNLFFAALWAGSALLFRNAAQAESEPKPDPDTT